MLIIGFGFYHVVNPPDSMGMPVLCPLLPMWGSFQGNNQRIGNQQGVITSISDLSNAAIPEKYIVFQNYPNPYNPITVIKYGIPADGPVDIAIYNITGQRVRQLVGFEMQAGYYQVLWDGRNDAGYQLPSGIYFYRMTSSSFTDVKKLVLIK